jgi:hypothetical protein
MAEHNLFSKAGFETFTTEKIWDLVDELRGLAGHNAGMGWGAVDWPAVAAFLDDARAATPAERQQVSTRLEQAIRAGQRSGGATLATMAATLDGLRRLEQET